MLTLIFVLYCLSSSPSGIISGILAKLTNNNGF